ncbi:hypothetical protein GLOIN_2v1489353 [Rhizophagus irregularis DAOM 181602=DAOM 197198]|uniref:Uncharacterized protein n=1 Tax=Rhizophagus irregularis (strain DAOM 181602 / DAOM 197198 / MUCL 43194) TaxID=747089 RepID=A0A2P4NSD6_RHIID|nr:hypothetical protein GLOIN_2v1489353 [Rhizophagus irregularis DAOM 181602=DAOM 197198]POG56052.1 hypothetical protein GLOIN_2v1489353 [Rhizophagus irregularis DAOM 181602=DAOM 197198]|eukprot:XP_025164312.1 hypothetical protein GLOIN_2v1489353 [Rhizophagus irregularis DAOM 181602=DAOM 197198]
MIAKFWLLQLNFRLESSISVNGFSEFLLREVREALGDEDDFVLEREVREALGDEDDFVLEREVREALGDEDDFVLKGDLKVLGDEEDDFVLKGDRKVSDDVLEVRKVVSSSSTSGGTR